METKKFEEVMPYLTAMFFREDDARQFMKDTVQESYIYRTADIVLVLVGRLYLFTIILDYPVD